MNLEGQYDALLTLGHRETVSNLPRFEKWLPKIGFEIREQLVRGLSERLPEGQAIRTFRGADEEAHFQNTESWPLSTPLLQ